MSKREDSLELNVSAEEAEMACRQAIAELGWRLRKDEGRRFVIKEPFRLFSFTWPAKVKLAIHEEGARSSKVSMDGSIWGYGPIQKGHLQSGVEELKNLMRLAIDGDGGEGGGGGEVSGELERLVELHRSGALTDEEFRQAKARALESG